MPANNDAQAAARAGVQRAYAASEAALARGELTAQTGITEGKIGYTLTKQIIGENQTPLVFALIALSFTAIQQGLAAYIWVDAIAKTNTEQTNQQMETATQNLQKAWKAAQDHTHT